jgi:hypothetical protein
MGGPARPSGSPGSDLGVKSSSSDPSDLLGPNAGKAPPSYKDRARQHVDEYYSGLTPEQLKAIQATGQNPFAPKPLILSPEYRDEFTRLASERAAALFKERQYKDGRNNDILLAEQSARRNSIFANDVQTNPVDLYRSLF